MRTYSNYKIFLAALLLLGFAVGCCNPGSNPNAGNPAAPQTLPTAILETPPNANVGVCPDSAIISVTFSKAMNPATINGSTFTLTGPGGAGVAGTVAYILATNIATFTPSVALAPSATFTATINTGAADTFGNSLAADFTWTFTTSSACSAPVLPVVPPTPPSTAPPSPLGAACTFGALAGATVTNVNNVGTSVSGDIGVTPGSAITGFPPGTLTGTIEAGNAAAAAGETDLHTAYTNFAGEAGGAILPADIGGQTLAPGVYKTTSAQPSLGITGNLTLSGPATGVWVFQVVSTLTTATNNSQVIMAGGGLPQNVFWVVGSSATLGTNTLFAGSIMAQASVTLDTGATLDGRALALTGGVTLDTNVINVPPCQ
jgi:hypothetical protein